MHQDTGKSKCIVPEFIAAEALVVICGRSGFRMYGFPNQLGVRILSVFELVDA